MHWYRPAAKSTAPERRGCYVHSRPAGCCTRLCVCVCARARIYMYTYMYMYANAHVHLLYLLHVLYSWTLISSLKRLMVLHTYLYTHTHTHYIHTYTYTHTHRIHTIVEAADSGLAQRHPQDLRYALGQVGRRTAYVYLCVCVHR